jgi:choline dehydrogenase-like flavoprotein
MILDMNDVIQDSCLDADICIIGSGAAGITIAREFVESKTSVILLEGGAKKFEEPAQDPYQSQVVGLPHGGIHKGRVRQIGGSTTLWAGQALPLTELDFTRRDWVTHSGWPFARSELMSVYTRAETVMQIPHATYDAATWPKAEGTPPDYDPEKLVPLFSQFTHMPNFFQKYRTMLEGEENIRLITHANVLSIEATSQANAVKQVRIAGFGGRKAIVRAKTFVVCCGGIESARLLLLSNTVEPNGIGNGNDLVGRFFQDHPGVSVPVIPRDPPRFAAWYDSFRRNGIRYAFKLTMADETQRQQQVLNVGGEIYYPSLEDDALAAAKNLLKIVRQPKRFGEIPGSIGSIARDPAKLAGAMYRYYVLRQPASVGSTNPHLGLSLEQAPNPDSRVTLGNELDSLGMRRAKLDWRLTELETRSARQFLDVVAQEWRRLEIGEIDFSMLRLEGREHGAEGGFSDNNHHIGTTRMGTDPKQSVTAPDCRVHGYDNLYIGSSAVFPTGGFSNPTLTVIALCLRIADTLKLRLPSMALAEKI